MTTVAQMTPGELREMIQTVVEETVDRKLTEILGDADEGLKLRKRVQERLLKQKEAVASGERGIPLEDVVRRLNLG